ncbi:hypothetical protein HMPREF9535_00679 [Escherichia coli MS 78-1]|nr:hypothetical protein HMPREF9535_00679 [Escherichia coli MS 78-1]KDA56480.1 hypothetical protein AA98_3497 [Escherichia coli 2-011-08_S1_C1]
MQDKYFLKMTILIAIPHNSYSHRINLQVWFGFLGIKNMALDK